MSHAMSFAERLSVIGGDDDHRIVVGAPALEPRDYFPDLLVHVGDAAVVLRYAVGPVPGSHTVAETRIFCSASRSSCVIPARRPGYRMSYGAGGT